MSRTPNLQLPEFGAVGVPSGQELTEGMRRLDAVVQASAIAFAAAPPLDAVLGDRYVVATPGTGVFAGWDRRLAFLSQAGWQFFTPENGWVVQVGVPPVPWVYDSSITAWRQETTGGGGSSVRMVGATWVKGSGQIEAPTFDVDVRVPVNAEIVGVSVATQGGPGDAVIDIWADSLWPPTVLDSICAAAKPTLAGVNLYEDFVLAGWDVDLAAGEWVRFHLDSTDTFTLITVQLFYQETP